jgi:hypothetical protein
MTVVTTSLRVRPNMLALDIRDEFGNTIMKRAFQNLPQLAEKLTYFELVQLHRANPLLFSQRLYHNQNITPLQLEHWKRFTKPGTSEMWPGKGELTPVAPVHDPDPFAPIPNRPPEIPEPVLDEPPEIPEPIPNRPPEIPEPVLDPDPEEDAQQLFIEADGSENQLVYAPPGTGKTHALIERLVWLSGLESVDQDFRILVLSFSKAVVKELRLRLSARLQREGLRVRKRIDIRTFDSCASQLMSFDFSPTEFLAGSHDQTIRRFIEGLREGEFAEGERRLAEYSHLFVDEIQDLTSVRADMVLEISKFLLRQGGSVTGLGDWGQAIYDWISRNHEAAARDAGVWDLRARYASDLRRDFEALLDYYGVNHRRLTRFWRYGNPELEAMAHSAAMAIGSYGHKANLYRFREEIRRIRHIQPVDIGQLFEQCQSLAVLTRSWRQLFRVKHFLSTQDIPVEIHRGRDQPWPAWISHIFASFQNERMGAQRLQEVLETNGLDYDSFAEFLESHGLVDDRGTVDVVALGNIVRNETPPAALLVKPDKAIWISTIHKAKGLEFPDVVVMEPDWQQIANDAKPEEARIMYVAITRGTRSVSLLEKKGFAGGGHYGEKYPLTPDGRGVQVDGIETIDSMTLLRTPKGGPITREGLDARRDALANGMKAKQLLVMRPEGVDRYWLAAPSTQGSGQPNLVCALDGELGSRLGRLPRNDRRCSYIADLGELVTVAFDRDDNVAKSLLGPALVTLAPLLSGTIKRHDSMKSGL